jgi:hypothetical protein
MKRARRMNRCDVLKPGNLINGRGNVNALEIGGGHGGACHVLFYASVGVSADEATPTYWTGPSPTVLDRPCLYRTYSTAHP